jgi:hypothetical protein
MLILVFYRSSFGNCQLMRMTHENLFYELVSVDSRPHTIRTLIHQHLSVRELWVGLDDCGSVQVDHGIAWFFHRGLKPVHSLKIAEEVNYALCDSGGHVVVFQFNAAAGRAGRKRADFSNLGEKLRDFAGMVAYQSIGQHHRDDVIWQWI